MKEEVFLEEILPLPSIPEQKLIVGYNNEFNKLAELVNTLSNYCDESTSELADYFLDIETAG